MDLVAWWDSIGSVAQYLIVFMLGAGIGWRAKG